MRLFCIKISILVLFILLLGDNLAEIAISEPVDNFRKLI